MTGYVEFGKGKKDMEVCPKDQYLPLKCWYPPARPHDAITEKVTMCEPLPLLKPQILKYHIPFFSSTMISDKWKRVVHKLCTEEFLSTPGLYEKSTDKENKSLCHSQMSWKGMPREFTSYETEN
jgi:hypothetical protein